MLRPQLWVDEQAAEAELSAESYTDGTRLGAWSSTCQSDTVARARFWTVKTVPDVEGGAVATVEVAATAEVDEAVEWSTRIELAVAGEVAQWSTRIGQVVAAEGEERDSAAEPPTGRVLDPCIGWVGQSA